MSTIYDDFLGGDAAGRVAAGRAARGYDDGLDDPTTFTESELDEMTGEAVGGGAAGGAGQGEAAGGAAGGVGSGAADKPAGTRVDPYARFSGSTHDELYNYIQAAIADAKGKEETEEERKLRERRERNKLFLANVGDIIGAMHRAYSNARGVKPVELENLTERERARIEKAKAEREANQGKIFNYMAMLDKLGADARNFDFNVEKARQGQANWEQEYEAGREYNAGRLEETNRHNKEIEDINRQNADTRAQAQKATATHQQNQDKTAQQNANTKEKVANAKITGTTRGRSGGVGSRGGRKGGGGKTTVGEKVGALAVTDQEGYKQAMRDAGVSSVNSSNQGRVWGAYQARHGGNKRNKAAANGKNKAGKPYKNLKL